MLTVYCYNIHSGKNLFYRPSLEQMIHFFLENPADIVCLQEVHRNSKNGWQFDQIMKKLKINGYFGGNYRIANGFYGNAVFSRFPILSAKNYPLPSEKEPRGVIRVILDIEGQPVCVLNTHLGLGRRERTLQMQQLEQLILPLNIPLLLMGDFNTVQPLSFPHLEDLGKKAGKESHPTIFPLKKRIDFIFASPQFRLLAYDVLPLTFSDHYPLWAKLDLS